MNPSSNEAFGTPLSSGSEQAPSSTASDISGQGSAEQAAPMAETAPAPVSPGMSAPPMLPLPPLTPSAPATPATNPMATTQNDAAALPTTAVPLNDDDLIEKEWVNKAKAIVEQTRDDPYRQSEELTAVKVDYMQKHYNKTIKLSK